MRCQEFESFVEVDGLNPLSSAAQEHLAECNHCQAFLADLQEIADAAHALPAEVDVPDRVWISLRAQLQAENILREPAIYAPKDTLPWWSNIGSLLRPRMLAAAGVGAAIALAAVLVIHKPHDGNVAKTSRTEQTQTASMTPPAPARPSVEMGSATTQTMPTIQKPAGHVHAATPTAATLTEKTTNLRPAPSEEIFMASSAALNQAENDVSGSSIGNPAVDAELRKDLKTVDEFIAECEKYLKKHPKDQLAREYLNNAYRQKAQLLAAMLDSGRSEQ